jgi:hypothetical protein
VAKQALLLDISLHWLLLAIIRDHRRSFGKSCESGKAALGEPFDNPSHKHQLRLAASRGVRWVGRRQ